MIEKIVRFFHGSLVIRVEGTHLSRFFNLCARHEIVFWKICYQSQTQASFFIALPDVYELRPYLKKTKTSMHIVKKMGFPFWLYRYRARKLCAVGFLCMLIGIGFLSTRVWRIEIIGNASIGEDTLLEYLQNHNITYGIPSRQIDHDALELSLRQDFDSIIWASVYEEGTKLVVHVQEKIAVSEQPETSQSCTDLVATKDATIAEIITRSGLATVKKGDHVKKGDVLVCGRQEILDDNGEVREYYYKSADADVYGYTIYPYDDTIPGQMSVETETGNVTKRYFIQIFEKRFCTPALHAAYANARSVTDTRQFHINDSFYLPVYWGTTTTRELQKQSVTLTKEEVKSLALSHFSQFLTELEENGVRIVAKNVMIEPVDNDYHIYGQVKVREKITTSAPTEIKRKEPVNESE